MAAALQRVRQWLDQAGHVHDTSPGRGFRRGRAIFMGVDGGAGGHNPSPTPAKALWSSGSWASASSPPKLESHEAQRTAAPGGQMDGSPGVLAGLGGVRHASQLAQSPGLRSWGAGHSRALRELRSGASPGLQEGSRALLQAASGQGQGGVERRRGRAGVRRRPAPRFAGASLGPRRTGPKGRLGENAPADRYMGC